MKLIKIIRICILVLMLIPFVNAAYEDFTTYTEVDPNSRITKNSTQVSFTAIPQNEDSYVYKDFGANYFDGDFTHSFDFKMSAGNGYFPMAYALTNTIDDVYGTAWTSGQPIIGIRQSVNNGHIYFHQNTGGYDCGVKSTNTDYFVKIVRIESQNKIYAGIYSTSALRNTGNGTDADVCNAYLSLSSSLDFRYLMVSQSYNNGDGWTGTGFTRYLDLEAGTSPTPTITTNIQEFYDSENISIDLNTTSNTNMSYFLDGGSETSICLNCNSTTLNLNSLSDGLHEIIFSSTTGAGQENTTANFTIDTQTPTINVFNTSEISSYYVDWTTKFNYSDTNLDTCYIIVENSSQNCSSYTFSENGDQLIQIYVNDSAGNSNNVNFTLPVDPIQYFYFEDYLGSPLTNFTFGGTTYSDYAAFSVFDLGYGNYTYEFVKIGYQITNVSFSLNSTSDINLTTAIGINTISVNIYDRSTETLINQSVTINLIGDPDNTEEFAGSFSTNNGTIVIDNISEIPGTYKLELSSSGYSNNEYYFTHTGFEAKEINIYLIQSNLTYPIKYIVQSVDKDPQVFCIFKVKQYFISSNDYLVVDMGRTNSLGQVIFDLEYDINYQYVIECDDQTQTEPGQKITETPVTITFNPNNALNAFEDLPNVAGEVTFGNYTNSSGYFRFEYNDLKNIVSMGCLYVYEKGAISDTLIYSKCQESTSATLNQDINWTIGDRYVAKGYVWSDGSDYLVDQKNKDFFPGADAAWALGFGFWGSFLIVLVLFLIGSIHHPITGAILSILGLIVSVGFKALDIEQSLIMGILVIVIGAILWRRRK